LLIYLPWTKDIKIVLKPNNSRQPRSPRSFNTKLVELWTIEIKAATFLFYCSSWLPGLGFYNALGMCKQKKSSCWGNGKYLEGHLAFYLCHGLALLWTPSVQKGVL